MVKTVYKLLLWGNALCYLAALYFCLQVKMSGNALFDLSDIDVIFYLSFFVAGVILSFINGKFIKRHLKKHE
jgi:hypothetical protein